MAETNSSSGASTAIVAVVAIIVLLVIVWFVFFRGGAAPDGGTDIDVDINPGDAVEEVTE
jgi:hypothetical protein